MKNTKFGKPVALATGVLMAVVLAGCGSSDAGSEGGTSAKSEEALAQAREDLAKYSDPASLNFPRPPEGTYDPGSHRVAIISCGQTGIGCAQQAAFAQDAAAAAGWEASETLDGKFDPNQQAAYVQQAINQDYDAIIMTAIDAQSISAAIDAAAAADIPVACIGCENLGMRDKVMDAATNGIADGEALSTYITVALEGEGKVVGFNDKSFPIVGTRMKGIEEGLKKYCPACEYEEELFPTSDLSKPGPPTWTGFLNANPPGTVDLIAGPYDFMSLPAAKTSAQAGRTDPLITGFDAYSEFVQAIIDGDPSVAVATAASPFEYSAWSGMDLVARAVAGEPTWDASKMPVAVVTKDNAEDYLDGYLKPPFDVPAMFKEMWGKTS